MPVDTNLTDGITLATTSINSVLSTFLTPPLVYIVAFVIVGCAFGVVKRFFRPRR
jgi:hypothetical protein